MVSAHRRHPDARSTNASRCRPPADCSLIEAALKVLKWDEGTVWRSSQLGSRAAAVLALKVDAKPKAKLTDIIKWCIKKDLMKEVAGQRELAVRYRPV